MAVLALAVSNNATVVMGTPIAISIAAQMGQPAGPFVLAVLFGVTMKKENRKMGTDQVKRLKLDGFTLNNCPFLALWLDF